MVKLKYLFIKVEKTKITIITLAKNLPLRGFFLGYICGHSFFFLSETTSNLVNQRFGMVKGEHSVGESLRKINKMIFFFIYRAATSVCMAVSFNGTDSNPLLKSKFKLTEVYLELKVVDPTAMKFTVNSSQEYSARLWMPGNLH